MLCGLDEGVPRDRSGRCLGPGRAQRHQPRDVGELAGRPAVALPCGSYVMAGGGAGGTKTKQITQDYKVTACYRWQNCRLQESFWKSGLELRF